MPEDFFGEGSQWTILIPLIILIVFTFFMRRRKQERNPQEIAMSLLVDLNANHKILEEFNTQTRPKKLKIGSWQRNNDKLGFLDESLHASLSNFFRMAEDHNLQIDSAKRYKSISYVSGINVDRIKEPLTKSREGLQEWLKTNMEQMGPAAGRPGCLGGGFGG